VNDASAEPATPAAVGRPAGGHVPSFVTSPVLDASALVALDQ
jgi:hypothetical protein